MNNIPLYVYILFFVLLYMGFNRCFARVIKLSRLYLAPLFFILFSIRGMITLFNIQAPDAAIWIVGCALGSILGYLHVKNKAIKADHSQQLIQLPGDWSMLCLILAIFSFEVFVHYSVDAHWSFASTQLFKSSAVMILGVIAGLPTGRSFNYFLKYKSAPTENLVVNN